MANLESAAGLGGDFQITLAGFFDIAAKMARRNCRHEGIDLSGFAAGLHLHRTVGKVAHPAGHFEAGGKLLDRVPEANPLHTARIKDAPTGFHRPEKLMPGANRSPSTAARFSCASMTITSFVEVTHALNSRPGGCAAVSITALASTG